MDLRRWQCSLCGLAQTGLSGPGVSQVEAHLCMAHGDLVSSRGPGGFANLAQLGCRSCQSFRTSNLLEWQQHFASDYLSCSGMNMASNLNKRLFVSAQSSFDVPFQRKQVQSEDYEQHANYKKAQERTSVPWRTPGRPSESRRSRFHSSHPFRRPFGTYVRNRSRSTCLYCPERHSEDHMAEHIRWAHYDLQFWCKGCKYSEPYYQDMLNHIIETHDPSVSQSTKALHLHKAGLLTLPKDLRGLRCRLCASQSRFKFLLAQDRMELKEHIQRVHDVKISVGELSYTCRGCNECHKDTEAFLGHECCAQTRPVPVPPLMLHMEEGEGEAQRPAKVEGALIFDDAGKPVIDGRRKSAEKIGKKEEDWEQCLYCPSLVPRSYRASHRSKHLSDEIACLLCTKSFPIFAEVKDHFESAHKSEIEQRKNMSDGKREGVEQIGYDDEKMEEEEQGMMFWVKKFVADKRIKLPRDLRKLECSYCPVEVGLPPPFQALAQGRYALITHIKVAHGSALVAEKEQLKYSCRACGEFGFDNGPAFISHPCYLLNGGVLQRRLKTAPQRPNAADMAAIASFDPTMIGDSEPTFQEGDLRRMACKLCLWQCNGQKFHAMAKHLEENHEKKQFAYANERIGHHKQVSLDLEPLVHFSCASCGPSTALRLNKVLKWDAHFRCGFKKCYGAVKYERQGQETSLRRQTVGNQKAPGRGVEFMEEEGASRNERDIRALECRLCSHKEAHTKFLSIQVHLRKDHVEKTASLIDLDQLVRFKCLKCPDYKPSTLHEWDSHFYKSYEWCKVSWKTRFNFSNANEETATCTVETIEDEEDGETDLRTLVCLLCPDLTIALTGVPFLPSMTQHLSKAHGKNCDKQAAMGEAEKAVRFGCANCPGFTPPTTVIWNRHFSKGYRNCQGSARVKDLVKKKLLFWCDLCRETRDDFDGHLQGPAHKAQVEARVAKLLLQSQEEGETSSRKQDGDQDKKLSSSSQMPPALPLVRCDLCDVRLGSEANKHLHERLGMHKTKEKELLEGGMD